MERGYDFYEHTADIGIHAWGPTLDVAFAEAAKGLVANMVDTPVPSAPETRTLNVEGENIERLLYHFLDEVLFLFQTESFVPTDARVTLHDDTRLEATLTGESYDEARHGHVHEIKAITYHEMQVTRSPADVRVIVDI